jgi:uncharacterized membrane protein YesL
MTTVRMAAEGQDADFSRFPILVGRTLWSNLPLLLVIDAVLSVGAIPTIVLFFGGGSLLAPIVCAITLGPLWAGTVAAADRMVRDEAVSLRAYIEEVWRHAGCGVKVSLVPATIVTAMLGTLAILDTRPSAWWLFVPLSVDGSALILVFLAGFSVFSLATTSELRGWALWRASLGVVTASPVTALGTVALLVLLGLLVSWAPGFLPVFPAPFAVYMSASTWATLGRWRERLEQERAK